MKLLQVEKIAFTFDDDWTVVEKWDDSRVFRNGIMKLNGDVWDVDRQTSQRVGTKAVDILGVRGSDLYFIEVKDFRGHPETKAQDVRARAVEIACKVRDTLAGVVGANCTHKEPWVETCAALLARPGCRVIVVAWIEERQPVLPTPAGLGILGISVPIGITIKSVYFLLSMR